MNRTVAYWVTTALVEFELILGGIWDVLRTQHVRGLIHLLGYPEYFLIILGVWKLLGAVALVMPGFPRLKEWTYAGVIFNFTGAIASHLAAGVIDAGVLGYLTAMMGITVCVLGFTSAVPTELPTELTRRGRSRGSSRPITAVKRHTGYSHR